MSFKMYIFYLLSTGILLKEHTITIVPFILNLGSRLSQSEASGHIYLMLVV